jgi:hypothetical protein
MQVNPWKRLSLFSVGRSLSIGRCGNEPCFPRGTRIATWPLSRHRREAVTPRQYVDKSVGA